MTRSFVHGRRAIALVALAAAGLAAVVGLLLIKGNGPAQAGAADHLDAPGLTPPGGDLRADLTDVYAWKNGAKTVIAFNVNGLTAPGTQALFGRAAPSVARNKAIEYWALVDSNGDAVADKQLKVSFGAPRGAKKVQRMRISLNGKPILTGWSSPFGEAKVYRGQRGVKAFAGMRDDPFFFDLDGFINILAAIDTDPGNNTKSFIGCTGARTDKFAGSNVSAIVLEIPSRLLTESGSSKIGIWAATTIGGTQVDRMGRPAINTVFNPNNPFPGERVGEEDSKKLKFNAAQPKDDQADYRSEVVDTLTVLFSLNDPASGLGGTDDPSDDASKIGGLADVLLPDILTFDTADSNGFLNGRKLADDVIDAELGLVTEGLVTTDCVGANDVPFSAAFPYLAGPHA
jgi:hypothetical protein